MPGLIRGMARTAAVVGTATATRNAVNRRQADKNAQAYSHAMSTVETQQAPPPQDYAPPPQEMYAAPPPAQTSQEDVIAQLERLGDEDLKGDELKQEIERGKAVWTGTSAELEASPEVRDTRLHL